MRRHRAPNEPCLRGSINLLRGQQGFPRGPTCLRISQPALLLAVADMVTSSTHSASHGEDIMGIMAGLAAVIGVFFPFLPSMLTNITCLCSASIASDLFRSLTSARNTTQRLNLVQCLKRPCIHFRAGV